MSKSPAELFAVSAQQDFAATSPFYGQLAAELARRPELLGALDQAQPGQRHPILLLAAMHDTLLAHPDEPLAEWYPTLRNHPRPVDPEIATAWANMLDTHRDEVTHKVMTRSVQTNEVNRCAALTLAYARAAERVGQRPMALVELGTSAGLNLHFDRYAYVLQHGNAKLPVGSNDAPLVLTTEVRGGHHPAWKVPSIGWRLGIDRDPLDPANADDARWLLACTWPDQHHRFERLKAALQIAAASPFPVRRADIVNDLATVLRDVPDDYVPLISHSWVLWYVAKPDRAAMADVLAAEATRRGGLAWVHAEAPGVVPGVVPPPRHPTDDAPTLVGLRWSTNGNWDDTGICWMHPHGTWLRPIL
jgi:hypothetical protein